MFKIIILAKACNFCTLQIYIYHHLDLGGYSAGGKGSLQFFFSQSFPCFIGSLQLHWVCCVCVWWCVLGQDNTVEMPAFQQVGLCGLQDVSSGHSSLCCTADSSRELTNSPLLRSAQYDIVTSAIISHPGQTNYRALTCLIATNSARPRSYHLKQD